MYMRGRFIGIVIKKTCPYMDMHVLWMQLYLLRKSLGYDFRVQRCLRRLILHKICPKCRPKASNIQLVRVKPLDIQKDGKRQTAGANNKPLLWIPGPDNFRMNGLNIA